MGGKESIHVEPEKSGDKEETFKENRRDRVTCMHACIYDMRYIYIPPDSCTESPFDSVMVTNSLSSLLRISTLCSAGAEEHTTNNAANRSGTAYIVYIF